MTPSLIPQGALMSSPSSGGPYLSMNWSRSVQVAQQGRGTHLEKASPGLHVAASIWSGGHAFLLSECPANACLHLLLRNIQKHFEHFPNLFDGAEMVIASVGVGIGVGMICQAAIVAASNFADGAIAGQLLRRMRSTVIGD